MEVVIVLLLLIVLSIVLIVYAAKAAGKNKKVLGYFHDLQKTDNRFSNSKLFEFVNKTSLILISETGHIALKAVELAEPKIINIKDINGFEIIEDGKSSANLGGAVVGGLLFGGAGAIIGGLQAQKKITKMSFLFKTNNFSSPNIEIRLIALSVKKGSFEYQGLNEKIKDLMSTLEVVEKNCKDA